MTEPEIIFEHKDFIVVDKPAGLMVHVARVNEARHPSRRSGSGRRGGAGMNAAGGRGEEPTLTEWLVARYPEMKRVGDDPVLRPGIVHRLDKATSGVMIAARTQAAFERLKRYFQEHRMRKTYFALVRGVPRNRKGTIDAPIGITTGSLRRSVHSRKMAKPAVTEYEVVATFGGADGSTQSDRSEQYALLRVSPQTGRTHQIRVHLASIGHPIVGDPLYGGRRARRREKEGSGTNGERRVPPRLMLHASTLAFTDDSGNHYEFAAPLPQEFSVIHRGVRAE